MKISLLDLESPKVKDLIKFSKKFSIFEAFSQWINLIVKLINLVSLLFILVYFKCFPITIIIIIIILIQFKLNKKIVTKTESLYYKQIESDRLSDYIFGLLVDRNFLPEIRIYKMHKYLINKLSKIYKLNFKKLQKDFILLELIKIIENVFVVLLNCLSFVVIIIMLNGKVSVAIFILLIQVVNKVFSDIPTIVNEYGKLKSSEIYFRYFNEYLNFNEKINVEGSKFDKKHKLEINIKKLYFKYPNNNLYTLKNININIKKGEKIALVGENGSGKTTLVKIILGLFEVDENMISLKVGGKSISASSLNGAVRIVFQDYIRLLRTLRENVAIGNINNIDNDKELCKALSKANLIEFGNYLNDIIGPEFGGKDFSGGQWQKIAIARAYLSNSILTIFDEPTSSLDPRSEYNIFKNFINLGANNTSIIVTHRLFMTKLVDKIFLFKDGRIIESGSHYDLMKMHGEYEKMYKIQSKFYKQ